MGRRTVLRGIVGGLIGGLVGQLELWLNPTLRSTFEKTVLPVAAKDLEKTETGKKAGSSLKEWLRVHRFYGD